MSDTVDDDERKQVAYDPWTLQLVPLASQHHMSEYNRLKYGHRGSPVSYAPLSIHLPDVARSLRERQEKYADQLLWWPCTSPPASNRESSPVIPAAKQRAALATGEAIPHPDLQQQLSSAISEPIQLQQTTSAHVKTSETHPINVSQIIPPESLIAISSHLIPCKKPCPVLFEIHLPYSPDWATRYPQLLPPRVPPSQHKYLPSNSSVTGALNTALNTRVPFSSLPVPPSRILLSLKRTFKSHSVSDSPSEREVPAAISKSASCLPPVSPAPKSHLPPIITLPTSYALHPFSSHIRLPSPSSPSNKISKFRASRSRSSSTSSPGQSTVNTRPPKLGNLLLSSCPGKKVRLSGPVHGRSAICRDLDADLRRMKMLGARCVVCCLDDEELEFLIGASWDDYCQIAHREGLDVLRVPLPEGLAPLSPKALNADIDRIIQKYTLQGVSVLVHCRGGVGRAGLFACCWMLKLGLCGWIESDVSPSGITSVSETKRNDDPAETFQWDSETVVRGDTLQMVERVIEVIRRRRSVKAIETLEQVQFLVEYIDYLRACGHAGGDSCSSS